MCKCKELVFGKDDADEDSGCMAGEVDCDYDSEQGVCAILIFNKYTYFWQFAYLYLLSM